jgi:hypothetical protein
MKNLLKMIAARIIRKIDNDHSGLNFGKIQSFRISMHQLQLLL